MSFNVQIAGKSTRGAIDDSGTVLYFSLRRWLLPNIDLSTQVYESQQKGIAVGCRKEVQCNSNCRCGNYIWKVKWSPENENNRYLEGRVIIPRDSLSGQPVCELLPRDQRKMEMVCTCDEAKKYCKKAPM